MNDSTNRSVMQATAGIKIRMLDKRLNSHTMNMSIEPPKHFAAKDKTTDLHHKAEVMRVFSLKT